MTSSNTCITRKEEKTDGHPWYCRKCQHLTHARKCCAPCHHFHIHQKVFLRRSAIHMNIWIYYVIYSTELIRFYAARRTRLGAFESFKQHQRKFCRRLQRNRATQIKTCERKEHRKKNVWIFFPCQSGIKKFGKCWQSGKAGKSLFSPSAQHPHTKPTTNTYSITQMRHGTDPCINADSRQNSF